jgi:hypothetical protein
MKIPEEFIEKYAARNIKYFKNTIAEYNEKIKDTEARLNKFNGEIKDIKNDTTKA